MRTEDITGKRCVWPGSDDPLPLSRNQIKRLVEHAADVYGIMIPTYFADDVATGAASMFIEWQGFRSGVMEDARPNVPQVTGKRRIYVVRSFAGTLRNRGLAADEILVHIDLFNERRCDPPLPERDLVRIAREIAEKDAARPLVPEVKAA